MTEIKAGFDQNFPPNFDYKPHVYDPQRDALYFAFVAKDESGLTIVTDARGQKNLIDYSFTFFRYLLFETTIILSRLADFTGLDVSEVDSTVYDALDSKDRYIFKCINELDMTLIDWIDRLEQCEAFIASVRQTVKKRTQPKIVRGDNADIDRLNRAARRAQASQNRKRTLN